LRTAVGPKTSASSEDVPGISPPRRIPCSPPRSRSSRPDRHPDLAEREGAASGRRTLLASAPSECKWLTGPSSSSLPRVRHRWAGRSGAQVVVYAWTLSPVARPKTATRLAVSLWYLYRVLFPVFSQPSVPSPSVPSWSSPPKASPSSGR